MQREDKFVLGEKRFSREDLYLKGYSKGWEEKLTFTIGISYLAAGSLGLVSPIGRLLIKTVTPYAMKPSGSFLERVPRYANKGACVSLMFCLTRKFIELIFEEELNEVSHQNKLLITGGLTGALYKSTLGLRPMVVGSLLGIGTIYSISQGLSALNKRGLLSFNLDF